MFFFPSEVAVHFILSTVCPQHSTFSLSLSLNTPHLPLGREEGHKRGTRGEILETGGAASLSSSWMDERMDAQFSFGLSSFIFGRNPYFTTFSLLRKYFALTGGSHRRVELTFSLPLRFLPYLNKTFLASYGWITYLLSVLICKEIDDYGPNFKLATVINSILPNQVRV